MKEPISTDRCTLVRKSSKTLAARALLASLAVAALPAVAWARADFECVVKCLAAPCQLAHSAAPAQTAIDERRPTVVAQCATAALRSGTIDLLVQTNAGVRRVQIKARQDRLAEAHPAVFSTARCLGLSPACNAEMNRARTTVQGGKGIDAAAARWLGDPCGLGLPCGQIMKPELGAIVALQGLAADGFVVLQMARGGGQAVELPVSGGRFVLPAQALAFGSAYQYTLLDAARAEVAAGEFDVLSQRMQAEVRGQLQAAQQASSGDALFERVEVLLDNGLLWDARQINPP
jgi:hypothetical protein